MFWLCFGYRTFKSWILSKNKNSTLTTPHTRTPKKTDAHSRVPPERSEWMDSCHQNGIFTYFFSKPQNFKIFLKKISNFKNLIFCQNLKISKSVFKISNLKNLSKSQNLKNLNICTKIWDLKIIFNLCFQIFSRFNFEILFFGQNIFGIFFPFPSENYFFSIFWAKIHPSTPSPRKWRFVIPNFKCCFLHNQISMHGIIGFGYVSDVELSNPRF